MSLWDEADATLKYALRWKRRLEARTFVAQTSAANGRYAPGTRQSRRAGKAYEHLKQAVATAEELGMEGVIREVKALKRTII